MTAIRVLVADDHAILREGIRLMIEAQPEMQVVGEAADGREAISKTLDLKPDVVLMDIAMPVMNGLDATREIKKTVPETHVVVLTMHDGEEYVLQILHAGASGYVLKRAVGSELLSAIRAVHQGGSYLHPTITKRIIDDYLRRLSEDAERANLDGLTERELQVLKLIAAGGTNHSIAEQLCLSIKTVQTHRTHIMEKLGAHDRTELVKYAIRKGLVTLDP